MPNQNAKALLLQGPDGEKQQRQSGQRVAEGNKPERRHQQDGSRDQGKIVESVWKAVRDKPF